MLTFGLGLTISKEEMDICSRLTRPAWIVVGLTNDLVSWEKEYEAATRTGAKSILNAIWVFLSLIIQS